MIISIVMWLVLAQSDPLAGLSSTEGKKFFDGQCAVCHGIGGGGGTGPSLQRGSLPRAASNQALVDVIREGIPNTQMPGAWQMTDHEARLVAAYVRSIGKVEETPITGDAGRGLAMYRKLGCANCHIAAGVGTALGPELTAIGLRRTADHLKQSIVDPGAEIDGDFLTVRVVARDGKELKGLRVNEDSFTIQVKDMSGHFHSFARKDLTKVERLPKDSLMPSYKGRLQASELDDLVAYLASLR